MLIKDAYRKMLLSHLKIMKSLKVLCLIMKTH